MTMRNMNDIRSCFGQQCRPFKSTLAPSNYKASFPGHRLHLGKITGVRKSSCRKNGEKFGRGVPEIFKPNCDHYVIGSNNFSVISDGTIMMIANVIDVFY